MKRINKERKKLTITKKDLFTEDENSPLYDFNRMTEVGEYQFRIRKYLYEKGTLSAKGFLYNNDILTLPGIAKKNSKGEILLDSFILSLLERFQLAQKIHNSNNSLLALLVDTDDSLYHAITKADNTDDVFSSSGIAKEVNNAYSRVVKTLLDFDINNYILNNEELDTLASIQ